MKKIIWTSFLASWMLLAVGAANAESFNFYSVPGVGPLMIPDNAANCDYVDGDYLTDDTDCFALTFTSGSLTVDFFGGTLTGPLTDLNYTNEILIQDLNPEFGGLGVISGTEWDTDNVDSGAAGVREWISIGQSSGPVFTINGLWFSDHFDPNCTLPGCAVTEGNDVELWFWNGSSYSYYDVFALSSGLSFWNVWVTSSQFVLVGIGDSFYLAGITVPEPATIALFGLGLLGMGAARRRRVK